MIFGSRNKGAFIECNYVKYPLICDNAQYEDALVKIKEIFTNWIHMELRLLSHDSVLDVYHPVLSLSRLPIRSLPYNDMEGLFNLKSLLNSVEFSGTNVPNRFIDTIQLIQLTIPLEIQMVITGKFLWAMTQGVVIDTDGSSVYDIESWEYILREYPWIPYLIIYQEITFTESMSNKFNNYLVRGMQPSVMATK